MTEQGRGASGQPCMMLLQQPSFTAQVGAEGHHSDVLEGCLQAGGSGGIGSGTGGGGSNAAVAAVHGLSCERPDGKLLFQDVSFQVHPGQLPAALRYTCLPTLLPPTSHPTPPPPP